jgi:hypothetical protein
MSKPNIMDLLRSTLQEIQNTNQNEQNAPKADPSIFDFLKEKLSDVDQKTKTNIQDKSGNNVGIFDLILDKLTNAQKENQENPNVQTAPGSIFDMLREKVTEQKQHTEQRNEQRAQESIGDIIHQYNIDVSNISQNALQQIQLQYVKDNAEMDKKYAQYIYNLNNQQQGR